MLGLIYINNNNAEQNIKLLKLVNKLRNFRIKNDENEDQGS